MAVRRFARLNCRIGVSLRPTHTFDMQFGRPMILEIPHDARMLLSLLESDGHDAFLVGGWVRDALMGVEGADIDIATSSPAEHTMSLLRGHGISVVPTGLAHGTVTAVIDSIPYEITTFRVDGEYSDSRHPDSVRFCASIDDDLSRRDFTINAIAYSPRSGLVDPFDGRADIEKRIVRCVGDPDRRFDEDALRIMRALRFSAQLGFAIDQATAASLVEHRELLDKIARERIGKEFAKLVGFAAAPDVLEAFPQVFAQILPDVDCAGSRWWACVEALQMLESSDLSTRLATLMSCVGDGRGGDACAEVLRSLRFSNKVVSQTSDILMALDAIPEDSDEAQILLCMGRAGSDAFMSALDVKEAFVLAEIRNSGTNESGDSDSTAIGDTDQNGIVDFGSSNDCNFANAGSSACGDDSPANDCNAYVLALEERLEHIRRMRSVAQDCLAENKPYRVRDLAISGNDLVEAGIEPGPEIGRILDGLLHHVVQGSCENARDQLLELAAKLTTRR